MTTWARLSPVDEVTGLIRWVLDIPGEPSEPRVFNASVKMATTSVYNRSPCYDNNGGCGLTRSQARNAAIGEGLERYCCSVFSPDDLFFGSFSTISASYPAIAPQSFALFHPGQNGSGNFALSELPLAWTWAWHQITRIPVLVPACLVYMPYAPLRAYEEERILAPAVSTGLACATSLEEAVLRGLYELVERDAFMILWSNRLPMPRVDVMSHPALRQLYTDRLERDGLEYLLIRTTTDIPIPSFLCLVIDHRQDPPLLAAGGAASLDPVSAATKAMIEAVQTREWAKFLGRDGSNVEREQPYHDIRQFEDHVRLYAYGDMFDAVQFLFDGDLVKLPEGNDMTRPGDPCPLGIALNIFERAGLDVLTLDLTTPDVRSCGYSVVRTMVPQLQPLDADHNHRFLGGTRLYDVPRRLGYRSEATRMEDLNPDPHPYP